MIDYSKHARDNNGDLLPLLRCGVKMELKGRTSGSGNSPEYSEVVSGLCQGRLTRHAQKHINVWVCMSCGEHRQWGA